MQFGRQLPYQLWQRHVRPAQDRGNPSIDQDREPWVRRRLNVFAFVSAPVDTSQHLLRSAPIDTLALPCDSRPALSPAPSSDAVSRPTRSESQSSTPPRSLPCSRRRRSATWSALPPHIDLVSAPIGTPQHVPPIPFPPLEPAFECSPFYVSAHVDTFPSIPWQLD